MVAQQSRIRDRPEPEHPAQELPDEVEFDGQWRCHGEAVERGLDCGGIKSLGAGKR